MPCRSHSFSFFEKEKKRERRLKKGNEQFDKNCEKLIHGLGPLSI